MTFPLPAVGGDAAKDVQQRETHKREDERKVNSNRAFIAWCIVKARVNIGWLIFFRLSSLDRWFCCAQCYYGIDHHYDFLRWAGGRRYYTDNTDPSDRSEPASKRDENVFALTFCCACSVWMTPCWYAHRCCFISLRFVNTVCSLRMVLEKLKACWDLQSHSCGWYTVDFF